MHNLYKISDNIKNHWPFFLILIIILLRIFVPIITFHYHKEGIILVSDSYQYDNSALALLKTDHFLISPSDTKPQIIRTPGYPLFLAIVYWMFGHNLFFISLLQVTLTMLTIFIVIHIANKFYDLSSVIMVAFLLSICTSIIVESQYLLTETLFTLLLVTSVWVSIDGITSQKWSYYHSFFIGLLLSLATMVRPITYYLIIPAIFCYLYQFRYLLYGWKKSLYFIMVLLIPWIIIIGGWQIRNYVVSGIPDFCTIQAKNLFYYRGAPILAYKEKIPLEEAQKELASSLPNNRNISPKELNKLEMRIGLKLIINNPFIYFKVFLKGLARTLLGPGATKFHVLIPNRLIANLFLGLSVLVLFLSYFGILFMFINIKKEKSHITIASITIWCIIIYLLLVGSGGEAYSRFRIPIMPFIILYGGHGLTLAIQKYFRRPKHV